MRATVLQGGYFCSGEPYTVSTVLGSCVAVCLHDRASGVGGMAHFVLPRMPGREEDREDSRYGDQAVERLARLVVEMGGAIETTTAKIFGGTSPLGMARAGLAIGDANVEMAKRVLGRLGIPVVAERTGGGSGMTIHFDLGSGDVLLARHRGWDGLAA